MEKPMCYILMKTWLMFANCDGNMAFSLSNSNFILFLYRNQKNKIQSKLSMKVVTNVSTTTQKSVENFSNVRKYRKIIKYQSVGSKPIYDFRLKYGNIMSISHNIIIIICQY